MKIKDLPSSERPYEKLEMYGAKYLSNSELLAIIIKSGTKEYTSVELAQKVLKLANIGEKETLRNLQNYSIEEFMQIKGIGKIKAIQIIALLELTKRIARPIEKINVKINSSEDVANLIMDEMKYEKREYAKILILNNKNEIIRIKDISFGGSNYAVIEPKEIFSEAIKMSAPKIILIHNHPSGDATPSKEDINTTEKLLNISNMLGIKLLDHIVIGDGEFSSVMAKLLRKDV